MPKRISDEEHARRMYVHGHNSLKGAAAMTKANMRRIMSSPSVTEEARAIAVRIEQDAEFLEQALETRIDP